ncbi:hypothetical protein CLAIMM_10659 [Cladophialophora immunda]|nr:hypothetical protein CLAIMM_10659 [Cladophialophora immunda]
MDNGMELDIRALWNGGLRVKTTRFGGHWCRMCTSFCNSRDELDELSKGDKIQQWPVLALILAENGSIKDALPLTEEVVALRKSTLGGGSS